MTEAKKSALDEVLKPFSEREHLIQAAKDALKQGWDTLTERDREALLQMLARIAELRTRRILGTAGPMEQALETSLIETLVSTGQGLTQDVVSQTVDKYLGAIAGFVQQLLDRLTSKIAAP